MNIVDTMNSPELFGKTFRKRMLRNDNWQAWKAFLRGLMALPMDEEAAEIFRRCTARPVPAQEFKEAFVIVGRRGGKSLIAA